MFNFTNESDHLLSIATKDKATDVIKESLLNARKIEQKQLEDFVKEIKHSKIRQDPEK
jgi:hypothetical protein